MASYARTTPSTKINHQLSILAQAKPAIISVSGGNNDRSSSFDASTGVLSEKLNSTLRFSSKTLQKQESAREVGFKALNYEQQKFFNAGHIEDEQVIQKQNSSNQMRQAAVMAALASQQKVRLSATERLALTARKPAQAINQVAEQQTKPTNPSLSAQPVNSRPNLYHPAPRLSQEPPAPALPPPPPLMNNHMAPPPPPAPSCANLNNNKANIPMPTLETLLAVQRQLHQHTRKHLNNSAATQQVVTTSSNQNGLNNISNNGAPKQREGSLDDITSTSSATNLRISNLTKSQARNKPLPPSPPKSPTNNLTTDHYGQKISNQLHLATYDKDLPPLPASVSPSTATDDSQMSSLDSQSSPANSLVSIPPPPPPILSYLEQYDEVDQGANHRLVSSSLSSTSSSSTATALHYSSSSSASTPSTTLSSSADLLSSSVKQFFPSPVESFALPQQPQSVNLTSLPPPPTASFNMIPNPAPLNQCYETQKRQPPSLAPKPHLFQKTIANDYQQKQRLSQYLPSNQAQTSESATVNKFSHEENIEQPLISKQNNQQQQVFPSPQAKLNLQNSTLMTQTNSQPQIAFINQKSQINYQDHLFTPNASCSSPSPLLPPPPPPPLASDTDGSFDELDSGSFRFPTPPLPESMLDDDLNDEDEYDIGNDTDDDDDDDDDFQCKIPTPPPQKSIPTASFQDLHQQQAVAKQSALFNSSTFSVPPIGASAGSVQPPPLFRQQQPTVAQQTTTTGATSRAAAQLTVHINNEVGSGLLSTTTASLSHNMKQHHLDGANQHGRHHHHIMMGMTASSSSPSSSSDGDGQSSNASSSTSGIHSSIDSSSSSSTNSKLDDFNYSAVKLLRKQQQQLTTVLPLETTTATTNRELATAKLGSSQQQQQQLKQAPFKSSNSSLSVSSVTGNGNVYVSATTNAGKQLRRPALKQKKSVSFSDKVELVACAEEQSEDHLPNPLLARVLAGKLQ